MKPFALEELLMRIKAILKRTELPTVYRFHDIEVLIDEQRVIKAGKEVKLPLKEFLLLEYVAQRLGQAVSRTDLIDYIR
ncbi:response regulator transcription factor [Patescibacteria group bacterium]|nr:response regulator transcription factor [Patescibacteria group bacterium]